MASSSTSQLDNKLTGGSSWAREIGHMLHDQFPANNIIVKYIVKNSNKQLNFVGELRNKKSILYLNRYKQSSKVVSLLSCKR